MQFEKFNGHAGLKLAADVGGDPTHPSVILLHGGGQTRHSWQKAANELVQMGYYVISLDLRGHGQSDWAEDGDYSLETQTRDLEAVINTLQTKPALVGASLGGIIALITAAKNSPSIASAVVLVDVVPKMEQSGIDAIQSFMLANKDGFDSIDDVAESVSNYMPHRPKPKNTNGLMKNLRKGSDGRFYWHWDPAFMEGDLNDFTQKMESAAKGFSLPTLILRGVKSELVTEAGVKSLKELIPQAQYMDISSAGHMIAGDNNDAFNDAMESFLSEHIKIE